MTLIQLWLIAIGLVMVGLLILLWGKGKTIIQGQRTTHREHHLLLVVIGGTCAGLGSMFMLVEAWDYFKSHPPNWWVKRETYSDDPESRQRAIRTMIRRVYEGQLPDETLQEAIDRSIRDQADPKATWEPTWGELVSAARETGNLPEEKWKRYVDNAIDCTPTLEIRPRIRRGAPIPVIVHGFPWRGNTPMYSPGVRLLHRLKQVEINGKSVTLPTVSTLATEGNPRWQSPNDPFLIEVPASIAGSLQEGEQTLRLVLDRVATEDVRGPRWGETMDERRFDLTTRWRLTNGPTVSIVHDPHLAEQMQSSLAVHVFQRPGYMEGSMALRIIAQQLPMSVAGDVILRNDGVDRPLASVTLTNHQSHSPRLIIRDLQSQTLQLILRPSVAAAERTVDLTRIWGGEITLNIEQ